MRAFAFLGEMLYGTCQCERLQMYTNFLKLAILAETQLVEYRPANLIRIDE